MFTIHYSQCNLLGGIQFSSLIFYNFLKPNELVIRNEPIDAPFVNNYKNKSLEVVKVSSSSRVADQSSERN